MAFTFEEEQHSFWKRVDRSAGPAACWPWMGAIDTPGYGAARIYGKKKNAHRVAYLLTHGDVPHGLQIAHSCDNRLCCNPAHLRACTRKENMADCIERGRIARGERGGNAQLDTRHVLLIRRAHAAGVSSYEMAKILGMAKHSIQDIVNRINWRHVS